MIPRWITVGMLLAAAVVPSGCILVAKEQKNAAPQPPTGGRYLMSALPATNSAHPTIVKMDTVTGEAWYVSFNGCPQGSWNKF